jgi:hypothetical protein
MHGGCRPTHGPTTPELFVLEAPETAINPRPGGLPAHGPVEMMLGSGQPVDCYLMPGSYSDVRVLKTLQFDLPEGRQMYADKAYNDYALEDVLEESVHLQ